MSDLPVLDETWKTLRALVDERLAGFLETGAECPPRLREAMSYSLLAGGKRLRPVLLLSACEACGGEIEAAMPAACAIEMVHTYSLVHDDLPAMDDDALRRGRPTNHVRFGEGMAILAGDALLTLAFEIIARDVRPGAAAAACCADLAAGAGMCGMVGGQVADLEAETGGIATLDELEAIHRRKTGRLIRSAVTMGARIAEADPKILDSLENYGRSVGLAFQIADDLLDVTSTAERMGKAVGKDADHGKLTYPALLGVEESRRACERAVAAACQAISSLGERGRRLEALAHFVLGRDH